MAWLSARGMKAD